MSEHRAMLEKRIEDEKEKAEGRKNGGLSTGAKAAIGLSVVAVILLIIFALLRSKWRSTVKAERRAGMGTTEGDWGQLFDYWRYRD